jgi:hypothetical protein
MAESASTSPRSATPVLLAGSLGLVVGAVGAGAIFFVYMERMQVRHQAQLAAAATVKAPELNFGQGAVFDMRDGVDAKVKKFGTEFIDDLESNRLQSAYRSMSPDFQMKNKREAFDKMIADNPAIRKLTYSDRVEKVRKGTEAGSYEFYLTASERGADANKDKVNFALRIVKINDEWRVADFEIDADSKPKKK